MHSSAAQTGDQIIGWNARLRRLMATDIEAIDKDNAISPHHLDLRTVYRLFAAQVDDWMNNQLSREEFRGEPPGRIEADGWQVNGRLYRRFRRERITPSSL